MDYGSPTIKLAPFLEQLQAKGRPIVSDGAMGTLLNQRGISFDHCFDELNLTRPALVAEVHQEYIEAGANMIQTNTFGANRFKLSRHGLDGKLEDINTSAVELARRVALASTKPIFIAGDIGPLGVRLVPFGRIQVEQAHTAFAEQIQILARAGVDLLIMETMTDVYELSAAIYAARQTVPNLPIIASMTFTRDDRTLLGDNPARVAQRIQEAGADVIGVNCSGGPAQILRILKQMRQAVPDGLFSVMPNAGWPEQVSGRIMYPAVPEYFSEYALEFWQAGAGVIGGCCGTTPQHIQVMARAIQSATPEDLVNLHSPIPVETDDCATCDDQPTQFAQKLASGRFAISVEMDPPRGVSTHKMLAGASLLAESGADVINVADSPMARMRMSPWAVCSLIQSGINIETVVHFPTRGRSLLRIQGDLLAAHALDVRNVFVVMGDPTSIGDYPNAMDNYDLVPSGLIKLIKKGFNTGVDHAGMDIGQPTSFFVGSALNFNPADPAQEMKSLHRKIKCGADFLLTQPVYQPETVRTFLEQYQEIYGPLNTPILAGILPLVNARHASFLHHEVPGINIPENIYTQMQTYGDKDPHVGVEIAIELIEQMKPYIQGIYLIPAFGRYDQAAEIIETIRRSP